MNPETEADIVRALGRIASNGHLVKGYKRFTGAWSGRRSVEAEVEYQDKQSFAITWLADRTMCWLTNQRCAGIAGFGGD